MRRRAGFTLLEMMVYGFVIAVFFGALAVLLQSLYTAQTNVARNLTDVEIGRRLVEHVRGDLRRAEGILAEGNVLRLVFPGKHEGWYRFDPEDFTVRAETGRGEGLYEGAFESVRFSLVGRRLVAVDIELRKRNPKSQYRARWRSVVCCPNLED